MIRFVLHIDQTETVGNSVGQRRILPLPHAKGVKEMTEETNGNGETQKKNPLNEIIQPFIDLVHAPRALMGIYVSYFLEGLVYFGILTILGKYMSENVGLSDEWAGLIYSFFTAGITLAMLFLGGVGDRIGIRKALILSLLLMLIGRLLIASSSLGNLFTAEEGLGSPMFWCMAIGLLIVVLGYGMYQPSSYAGVKKFTNKKTATMGYAVIYALMNLGAFFSGFLSPPIRQSLGIGSVYWVYTFFTFGAVLAVFLILTKRTEKETAEAMKAEAAGSDTPPEEKSESGQQDDPAPESVPAPAGGRGFVMLASIVLGLGCVAGLVYSYTTRDLLPSETKIDMLTEETQNTLKVLAKVEEEVKEKKGDEEGQAEALKELGSAFDEMDAFFQSVATSLDQPDEFTGEMDAEGVLCLKQFWASQERYIEKVRAATASFATIDKENEVLQTLRDALRAHGIFAMLLSYSMVADVNEDVAETLRKRFKESGEDIIPMPDQLVAEGVALAGKSLVDKLTAYSRNAGEAADLIMTKVPGGALAPVAIRLRENSAFAQEAASSLQAETTSEAVSNIIKAKLLADADYAIDMGQSLGEKEEGADLMKTLESWVTGVIEWIKGVFVDKEEESEEEKELTNLQFLSSGLKAFSHTAEEAKDSLGLVYPVPVQQKLMNWCQRYGLWSVGIILFTIATLMIFLRMRPDHPFNNIKFVYFIFILIPVQTLFAHNWLTLPYYINRAFGGTKVGDWFEFFSNINPLLIFFLAPIVAALTARANVFRMMILGTLVMAAPTFLLALPPSPVWLLTYIVIMSVGEAMWQPRFLQYVAELAPEGKTGIYMGIAQFPWFLTKMVTGFYSGWFLSSYCPKIGPQNPQTMWLVYGFIAMISPVALWMTSKWIQSGLAAAKTKHE